ncbi:MAG: WD40/YVTN/BNR-like repeat-containing protein, partial [Gemmataceae bacterium]
MRAIPLFLLTLLAIPSQVAAEVRSFDDAALRSVFFIEDRQGWSVGDDGVIWHTIDGGKNWERQPSGVRASLRSVHFIDPFVGWIAGREELPGGGSCGVVLYTRDGGV